MLPAAKANQKGFTLIELVMTIVILGVMSLILIPFYQSITSSPDPVLRQRAIAMGQALMDEILSKKWDHNTPVGGGPIYTTESSSQDERLSLPDDQIESGETIVGEETPAARQLYQAVDDYEGHSETDDFWDQNGEPFTMRGYGRQATVRYISSSSPAIDHNTPAADTNTDSKLVVVTVTTPTNETLHFVSVVCNL